MTPGENRSMILTAQMWMISDTHFNHRKITEYEPIRQTLGRDHNVVMIERWREVVREDDTILHLGDVALGKSDDFARVAAQLTGRKLMLWGNHDGRSKTWYMTHDFTPISDFGIIYKGWKVYFSHAPTYKTIQHPKHLNVHGHVHSATKHDPRYINLSVEVIDFRPVWLPDVLDARITELERGAT